MAFGAVRGAVNFAVLMHGWTGFVLDGLCFALSGGGLPAE